VRRQREIAPDTVRLFPDSFLTGSGRRTIPGFGASAEAEEPTGCDPRRRIGGSRRAGQFAETTQNKVATLFAKRRIREPPDRISGGGTTQGDCGWLAAAGCRGPCGRASMQDATLRIEDCYREKPEPPRVRSCWIGA
jgi:hypothetical protein